MQRREPDWELVARSKNGDLRAFEVLVKRYENAILNFSFGFVGVREDAEDLTQETFVRAYRALGRYRPSASFTTWLFTIARNLCLNFTRDHRLARELRVRDNPSNEDEKESLEFRDDGLRPDLIAQRNETYELVLKAMEKLSAEHKEVLLLREFETMSYEDISSILGCRIGTVKSRLARAREQLAELLRPVLKQ